MNKSNTIILAVAILLLANLAVWPQKPQNTIESIKLDQSELILPCPLGVEGCGPTPSQSLMIAVQLLTTKISKKTKYQYTVTGGRIVGVGRNVTWDLSNTAPGSYHVIVSEIRTGKTLTKIQSETVRVVDGVCVCDCLNCPLIRIFATKRKITGGDTVSVSASITGGSQDSPLTLNWTLSVGQIISGQGTEAIQIKVPSGTSQTKLIVTLTIGGLPRACSGCPVSESETIDLEPLG